MKQPFQDNDPVRTNNGPSPARLSRKANQQQYLPRERRLPFPFVILEEKAKTMEKISYRTYSDKVILRTGDRLCENADELLSSKLAYRIISQAIHKLVKRNSPMLRVFDRRLIEDKDIHRLIEFMKLALKVPPRWW